MKIEDVRIIEDYKGNRFLNVGTDEEYKNDTKNIGVVKAGIENGVIYCKSCGDIRISLKKEDRRTINDVMFAKIVEL